MRKNVKSLAPTLWLVIAAFIITIFAVWGGAGRMEQSSGSGTLVSMGKDKISVDSFQQNIFRRLENLRQEFESVDKNLIMQLNLPQQVLEQMIQETLLMQLAKKLGIEATKEEIRDKIISYPVFQRDGKFIGFEEYKRILDWNRISLADFENNLKKEIIMQKTIELLGAGITVSRKEIWEHYQKENESAKIEYVFLDTEDIELSEEIKEEESKQYFEQHRENYRLPERRSGTLVLFETEEIKKEVELSENEIQNYYEDNIDQFKDPEKIKVSRIFLPLDSKEKDLVLAQARSLLGRIRSGENFADIAQEYSKDTKAQSGGDWGTFEWRTLPAAEQQQISQLEEGGISEPINLEDGVSILKITERVPEKTKEIDEVRSQIEGILKERKAREKATERIKNLEKRAKKQKDLEAAARESGYDIQKTGLLKQGEAYSIVDSSGAISQTLFSLQENGISSAIKTYNGVGIVQLSAVEAPRPAEYEEVNEDVRKDLATEKKKEKAKKIISAAQDDGTRYDMEKIAEKHGLEYKTVNEHKRTQYLSTIGENAQIDEKAFNLPVGTVSDVLEINTYYVLLKVLDRKEVTQEDIEKNIDTEKENLLNQKKNRFFHSTMVKLRREKNVKINYDRFLQINSEILSRYEK